MASFTKLRDGSWGITVEGKAICGHIVKVRKRSGEVKKVKIAKIIWTGNGKSICAITETRTSRASSSQSNGYVPAKRNSRGYVTERGHYAGYCGHNCPVTGRKCCPANGPCHDCE